MEPLSAASSVIAVVQVADRVIALCKAYITGVIDAPTDLRAILIEVGSVKCVLEVIKLLDQSHEDSENHGVDILGRLQKPLEGCKDVLKSLEALFPPQLEHPVQGKRKRLTLSLTTLAWPFKREKALKLLEELGRHKSTISLGLTIEAAKDLKDIRKDIEKIRKATTDAEMDRILRALVTTDPSPNHNNACELHEDHTGQWLINSPEYADWKSGSSRFLWLHGIPGAGKTVLHSFIAEDVRKLCEQTAGSACAFYYCYFGRNQDETNHVLRWIIHELCLSIGGIPQVVRNILNHASSSCISSSILLSMLEVVAGYFSRIYFTIDALDEAVDREQILLFIRTIIASPGLGHMHLLATSRKEIDIERTLSPLSVGLSLSNPYVDEDIRTYVKRHLLEDLKFSRWPESLKTETETALVKGAKGMFRWAFCQLDALKRLHAIPAIRSALTQLPKSLDETYERILCNIPPESHDMVYRTLSFLAAGHEIDVYQLADILAVDIENRKFDRKDRPFDLYAPVEAGTCLLTYDPESGRLYLAHYTVKEYLMSFRIGHGPAKMFQLTHDSVHALSASCFILYMLNEDYAFWPKLLMTEAIEAWPQHIRAIKSESSRKSLSTLVIQLLDPREVHYQSWTEQVLQAPPSLLIPLWSVEDGAECCAIFASLCALGLFEAAHLLLQIWKWPIPFHTALYWKRHIEPNPVHFYPKDSPDDVRRKILGCLKHYCAGHEILTVLQIALIYDRVWSPLAPVFSNLLVSKGADVNFCSLTGFSPLNTLLDYTERNQVPPPLSGQTYLDFILAKGAQTDLSQCTITPLQSAVKITLARLAITPDNFPECYRRVKILLETGARPNGVAKDDVNIERIRHTCKLLFRKYKKFDLVQLDESHCVHLALQDRGPSSFYDTPLRMLELDIQQPKWGDTTSASIRLEELRDLLISYGGKSLHLFPIKGLPGYIQEDMEEWNKLENLQLLLRHSLRNSLMPTQDLGC